MRSLGAVQALNLDGGGSSAMAVDGRLVNNHLRRDR
ncbi:phosphodiester glycosidase family protein [Streptomyces sp. NPDC004721]